MRNATATGTSPRWALPALVLAGLLGLGYLPALARETATISNPVAPRGNDPWVIRRDGSYLYCYSWAKGIWVNRSPRLEEAVQFAGRKVWTPPESGPSSRHVWAPELHFLRGRWYLYFAADDGPNENHRMFVLAATTDDPLGPYEFKGQLGLKPDRWAIDGSVLELDGALYFLWSGWEGNTNGRQDLYIARMADPLTIVGERVRISTPEHAWERHGDPWVNEGPTALVRGNKVHVIYSASGSWGNHYCLGRLTLVGRDPLRVGAWVKEPRPVFAGTASVISPGHASFVTSPDGTEDWIVYHAARRRDSGWDRNTRMQPFRWRADGTPDFGEPVAEGIPLPAPSARRK
ncbi:MAG: glycoside hydrolase family 43 protein [Verrucomicrobia bacterium]|nr:glycoside hydrolase family 43 protein [Verrucomicrobiota bacterium]